jgi:hypothetical protein
MAVKPWIGAIAEPTNHPPINKAIPDVTYKLEYCYGYRTQDSRQNLYYNSDGNIVFMSACLGIILDKTNNTQTFFGADEVNNESKQTASDQNGHTNDITCLKINSLGSRKYAVTG